MPRRKTAKEFSNEVAEKFKGVYVVLGDYVNSKTPILMRHTECGHTFKVRPGNLLTGNSRCAFCHPSNRYCTLEDVKRKVATIDNGEYVIVDDYVNKTTPIKFKHLVCGTTFYMTPSWFLGREVVRRCPKCVTPTYKLHHTLQYAQTLANKKGGHVSVISYKGEYNVLVKCTIHENVYRTTLPTIRKGGSGCPICAHDRLIKMNKKSQEEFAEDVSNVDEGDYELAGLYKGFGHKVPILHKTCGKVSLHPAGHFIRGDSPCPYCYYGASKGNYKIGRILEKMHIEFIREYPVIIGNVRHRYDFFIPSMNLFIEYNGQQHYFPVAYFGGEKTFIERKQRDFEKKQYADTHGYTLLSIPYTEYDSLDEVLSGSLEEHTRNLSRTGI